MALDLETRLDIARAVRAAFDELDLQQLAVLARLSPTRRLELMFDLCESARQLVIASERQCDPNISDEELARCAWVRIEMAHDI